MKHTCILVEKESLDIGQGVEGAAESLEQLWISYNQIDKLKPIRNLIKLHTLYMAHNMVEPKKFPDNL
jgi:dynein light chain 1